MTRSRTPKRAPEVAWIHSTMDPPRVLPCVIHAIRIMKMENLEIRYRLIADLQPRKRNPRKHSKKQLEQIASSIQHYGFTNPVLIDEADSVIAGHGRPLGDRPTL